ncbi:hypothetical protein ACLOJK_030610 [Asimina triloba]
MEVDVEIISPESLPSGQSKLWIWVEDCLAKVVQLEAAKVKVKKFEAYSRGRTEGEMDVFEQCAKLGHQAHNELGQSVVEEERDVTALRKVEERRRENVVTLNRTEVMVKQASDLVEALKGKLEEIKAKLHWVLGELQEHPPLVPSIDETKVQRGKATVAQEVKVKAGVKVAARQVRVEVGAVKEAESKVKVKGVGVRQKLEATEAELKMLWDQL